MRTLTIDLTQLGTEDSIIVAKAFQSNAVISEVLGTEFDKMNKDAASIIKTTLALNSGVKKLLDATGFQEHVSC